MNSQISFCATRGYTPGGALLPPRQWHPLPLSGPARHLFPSGLLLDSTSYMPPVLHIRPHSFLLIHTTATQCAMPSQWWMEILMYYYSVHILRPKKQNSFR